MNHRSLPSTSSASPPGDHRARRGPGGGVSAVRLPGGPRPRTGRLGAQRGRHGADRSARRRRGVGRVSSTRCATLIRRRPASTPSKSERNLPARRRRRERPGSFRDSTRARARRRRGRRSPPIWPRAPSVWPKSAIRRSGATTIRSRTAPTAARAGRSSSSCPTTGRGPRWPRFAMCADCQAEYDNPADRRFHAQPIACPRCGPALQLLDRRGPRNGRGRSGPGRGRRRRCWPAAIVAMKGLGGFQLLVDATNAEAVARLRQRKRRPDRPFALMLPSLDDVRQYCEVSDEEARELLTSHQVADRAAAAKSKLAVRCDPTPLSPRLSPSRSSPPSPPAIRTSASCCPIRRCTIC